MVEFKRDERAEKGLELAGDIAFRFVIEACELQAPVKNALLGLSTEEQRELITGFNLLGHPIEGRVAAVDPLRDAENHEDTLRGLYRGKKSLAA